MEATIDGNKPGRNQFIAAFLTAALGSTSIGAVFGFSAILLPQMEVEFQLDSKSEEASWIASIINLGQIFGALFFGAISDLIGRRMTLVFQSIPLVLGWLLIGISDGNFVIIIFGRILGGIGLISTVSQMYLVEIADSNNRGQFGALGAVFVSVGITKVYILGALLNWRTVCLICGVQLVLYILVLLFYLPETPLYLASKDKFQKTEKVLKWLRGPKYDICTELEGLKSAEKNDNERYLDKLRKFSKPSAYNPMIVLTVLFALQQWTGSYAVIFYSVNIFKGNKIYTYEGDLKSLQPQRED